MLQRMTSDFFMYKFLKDNDILKPLIIGYLLTVNAF